ncbi:MAG TPA: tRNA 2-thiouridine(34) synthase MnmA [Fusibacter sp.]|nr:tRNA 2-thiouridine(34) synthase MnmA [Fusibacter sp.]
MAKVAVGLSGGIDSGTTALMLIERGYEVIGVTMWLFDHQSSELEAAKKVADALGIQHHILDYRSAFHELVVHTFIKHYEQGFTPNPCLLCNKHFKYGRLIKDCVALGADYFATGHYVRCDVSPETGEYQIKRAINQRKDQSYNLYHLDQLTLTRLIFPLGHIESKDHVRARFSALNIELAQKKDSLGICFIPHKDHRKFLTTLGSAAMEPGNFVDLSGQILGHHSGTAAFTIGQKRRLGVDLNGQYLNGKYVVVALNPNTNDVVLGTEDDLAHFEIKCVDFNIVSPLLFESLQNHSGYIGIEVDVIVSQWSQVYRGVLKYDQADRTAVVTFESQVRAPAKGQALVCYHEEVLIGGGIIVAY